MKMFIVWQKVASYSEYLVEVDFLRIYTHINICCKSISFFVFWTLWGFQIDTVLELIICMGSSFLFCVLKPRELRTLLCVFLPFSSSFSSLFFLFLCYLCLLTYCIYIVLLFSVTVIFTSSLDALTMQTHSSFNHVYSFLASPQLSIATEEFMGS